MASIERGAQYGVAYRHIYGDGCPLEPRYIVKSDTVRNRGAISCPRCRGDLRAVRVTFAIVPWNGSGRYSLADAVATYSRERMADADASRRYEADNGSPYVVRSFVAA